MNIFSMPLNQMLALSEGEGGLFDFNATLPLMAIQFILLTTVLTFIFYKPIGNLLEEREAYINNNLSEASAKLVEADALCKQYEEQLKEAKINAQSLISEAEAEAKKLVAVELGQARKDAAKLIDQVNIELDAQKDIALMQLESRIDDLSQLIKEKLLGTEAAR
uniref:F1 sector of membrane-bound ATP synthase gamma subunit n=1 Tax=Chrysotila carterae TaxID=13221 RepID=UPI0022F2C1D7|nr:F1 sector of membrane-bound ATP synthase gamma subunit [Chrysotila carterae]WAK83153.1 F1 sector of membrane-bound ATP synthase gamma subunit [Chrysotila carterae]